MRLFDQVVQLSEELEAARLAFFNLKDDNKRLQKKLEQTEALWKDTTQALQTEIDQLRAELANERDRHDRPQDFEVAESKQLAEAKQEAKEWQDRFVTALKLLKNDGYDVSSLVVQIAVHRTLKEFGGKNE